MEGRKSDSLKISRMLVIGILGALIILAGDMLMGWGVRDTDVSGIESQLSPYLTISDGRMFWAAACGFTGVPLAVIGHYGIYLMLKPISPQKARLYGIGNLGFLTVGGAGVHVSSVEAAYYYKYMTAVGSGEVLTSTVRFAAFFLVPLYIVMFACWFLMVYAHGAVLLSHDSLWPRRALLCSMPVGTVIFSLVGVLGNHPLINALSVGAFSLGNVWTLGGHLYLLKKGKIQDSR